MVMVVLCGGDGSGGGDGDGDQDSQNAVKFATGEER